MFRKPLLAVLILLVSSCFPPAFATESPMLNPNHLRAHVVVPVLELLATVEPRMASAAAEELLMFTAMQESRLGEVGLVQLGRGPARGVWQVEHGMTGHDDNWVNFLAYRPDLASVVFDVAGRSWDGEDVAQALEQERWRGMADEMTWNLRYSAAHARIKLWRSKGALPAAGDIEGHARYWKDVYNTAAGAGRVEDFIRNAREIVALEERAPA